MRNQSGKTFENANIKLMAGDVNKLQPASVAGRMYAAEAKAMMNDAAAPVVREKSFDEFHLYTLARPTTLRDQETKQVEFVRSTGIHALRLFIYDGAQVQQYGYYNMEQIRQDQSYGTQSNPKVWVMEEFKNSEMNHLGIALPKGKLRFYRRDTDGHLEFVGENVIDHTPKDETIRIFTGNSFDVVGERKRTNIRVDSAQRWMDESFEIRVRNHKKEAGERARGRAPLSLDELEVERAVAGVTQDRRADGGVSGDRRAGWGAGGDVYRALFVVVTTTRVGADVLICPVERSSTGL